MKLVNIRLHPFAGVADRTVEFPEGLAVLLGDNEAGKSTLFAAIHETLFRNTKPRKGSDDWKAVQKYIPLTGNQSRVTLAVKVDGAAGTLERIWGHGAEVKLTENAVTTVGEDEAPGKIEALLPASRAVFESVFLAGQGDLRSTLEALAQSGAGHELTDMLRETVQVAGGVSVAEFEHQLASRFDEMFGQWDLASNGPKDGRGLGRPWVKGVGAVLKSWYAMMQKEADWKDAISFERKRDELERRLSEQMEAASKSTEVLRRFGNIEQGIRNRQNAALRFDGAVRAHGEYMEVNREWPVAEEMLNAKRTALPEMEVRVKALGEELVLAKAVEGLEPVRRQVARAEPLVAAIADRKARLQGLPKVTTADMELLRRAEERVNLARAKREASGMRVVFKAEVSGEVAVQVDGAQEKVQSLGVGESLSFTAASRWNLKHGNFGLSVTSGSEGGAQVLVEEREAQGALESVLGKVAMTDPATARSAAARWEEAERDLKLAERDLESTLEGGNLADLKAKIAHAPAAPSTRTVVEIQTEKVRLEGALQALRNEITAIEAKIAQFKRKYESHDALFDKVALASSEKKSAEKDLANLPQVPAEFPSAEAFLAALETARQQEKLLGDEINNLKIERAAHMGTGERTSADELKVEYHEAKGTFEQTLAQGHRLVRIREALDKVKATQKIAPLPGLKESFERYFSQATGNKYTTAHAEEGMPGGLVRASDGAALDFSLLSSGTKDLFALCLRFAMADFFLKDKEGFLLLDDPMVNLDPDRQKNLAALIQEVAKRHQVVVFTCHPGHRDVLGGETVRI